MFWATFSIIPTKYGILNYLIAKASRAMFCNVAKNSAKINNIAKATSWSSPVKKELTDKKMDMIIKLNIIHEI